MKLKLVIFSMLMFFASITKAQLTIATGLMEEGVFNDSEVKWDIGKSEKSLNYVIFDTALTSFTMYYKDMSTEEFKVSDWKYDKEEAIYDMVVTNSKGREFDLRIDGSNELFIFFYYNAKGEFCMYRYYILYSCFNDLE